MHICILTRSTIYHKTYGGMEHVAHDIAKELAKDGMKVTVITTSLSENQVSVKKIQDKYLLISLPNTKPMSYTKSWWIGSRDYFAKLNSENKIDLILSISCSANSLLKIKKKYNIPFVFQAHGTSIGEMQSKLRQNLRKKISIIKNIYAYFKDLYYIPKYDAVITIGSKVYYDYIHSIIKLNNNVILINNAVDTEQFKFNLEFKNILRSKLNIGENDHVFISTSRLIAQKGIKESINIFNMVQKDISNSFFIIIGDGPEKNNLAEHIKKLGLNKKVKLIGNVSRNELNKYYSCADYMLFSTLRQEGLPLTLLEALSNSLICFVSDKLDINGEFPVFSIDPYNPLSAAEKVKELIINSDKKSVKMKGVKTIQENYSTKNWSKKYINTFEKLL